jgi:hypothetical protein
VEFRLWPLIPIVRYIGEDVRDRAGRANRPNVSLSRKPEGAATCRLVGEIDCVAS